MVISCGTFGFGQQFYSADQVQKLQWSQSQHWPCLWWWTPCNGSLPSRLQSQAGWKLSWWENRMLGRAPSFCFLVKNTHLLFLRSSLTWWMRCAAPGGYFTDLHILVVLLKSFILYWSEATRRNCSEVVDGYQAMHIGTALCSTRSVLRMRSSFAVLFSKSYSTF